MHFIYFLLIMAAGFGLIKYSKWIVDNTMHFYSVEKYLGPGGTYTFWKLVGLFSIAFSFYYLFNL